MSSLQIALFKTYTITHKGFASFSSLHRAVFESVYVSVLCVCVSINFYFPFRSLLNACHPPSPLLFSVPLLSIRLPRLWTILCPVSVILGQPALRAARKVMFTHRTQLCCLRCLSCCFNLYNSQLHLSVSLSAPRAARACASCCGCLGRRTFEVGANFNAPSWAIG